MKLTITFQKSLSGLCIASCLAMLSGCGSDSDSSENNTIDSTSEDSAITLGLDLTPDAGEVGIVGQLAEPSESTPEELAGLDRVGLIIEADSRCAVVGESLNTSVTRSLTEAEIMAGDPATPPDVTAYVNYVQGLGDSLSLVSIADKTASFAFDREDIVSLTVGLDNGAVTAFLAGFAVDTPTSVVLRKPAPGGCLYAMRLPGYCVTSFSKSGALSFEHDGQSISVQGCELDNPGNLPVIELDPAPSAEG